MDLFIASQTMVLFYACVLGACLSIIYDVFRLIRITAPIGKVAIAVEDIIYFLIVSAATFVFMLCFTEGMIRSYVVLGELLGFVLCHVTLGALTVKLLGRFIVLVKKAVKRIGEPVLAFIKKQLVFCRGVGQKISVKHKKNKKKIKKDLQNNEHIGYNQLIPRGKRIGRCKKWRKKQKNAKKPK